MAKSITTSICYEIPQQENPAYTKEYYLRGYSLEDYLNYANADDMFWLFFKKDKLNSDQKKFFNQLIQLCTAISPRAPGAHAAMSAGVSQGTSCAMLIAALAANSGVEKGARELYYCVEKWNIFKFNNKFNVEEFLEIWKEPSKDTSLVWPSATSLPGFDLAVFEISEPIDILNSIVKDSNFSVTTWLRSNIKLLNNAAGQEATRLLVVSAMFADLDFTSSQSECLYLIFSLIGSSAFGLEQKALGYTQFPFPTIEVHDEL